jgi:hypothetical protein
MLFISSIFNSFSWIEASSISCFYILCLKKLSPLSADNCLCSYFVFGRQIRRSGSFAYALLFLFTKDKRYGKGVSSRKVKKNFFQERLNNYTSSCISLCLSTILYTSRLAAFFVFD